MATHKPLTKAQIKAKAAELERARAVKRSKPTREQVLADEHDQRTAAMAAKSLTIDPVSPDPVFSTYKNGERVWAFYDETWTTPHGPYPTEAHARKALEVYLATLGPVKGAGECSAVETTEVVRGALPGEPDGPHIDTYTESRAGHTEAPAQATAALSAVKHPHHYNVHPSGVEAIDIVQHFNFNLGNVIKYVWRTGLKHGDEGAAKIHELKKAREYLDFEIARIRKFEE